ncbi:hypothetical protein BC826DRAFT_175930 [Russula brevipes]|nr:hypothetical protein BC826DRAFT_175930 [Russula brevipes]
MLRAQPGVSQGRSPRLLWTDDSTRFQIRPTPGGACLSYQHQQTASRAFAGPIRQLIFLPDTGREAREVTRLASPRLADCLDEAIFSRRSGCACQKPADFRAVRGSNDPSGPTLAHWRDSQALLQTAQNHKKGTHGQYISEPRDRRGNLNL